MRKFILILSMVSAALIFVSCTPKDGNEDASGADRDKETAVKNFSEYTTITVVADLKTGHTIKVQSSYDEKSLSSGQCVNVRGTETKRLVISVEQNNVVSQLCSNIDENENNNCKGNYNIIYKLADSQTGANKLTLKSADRNESEDCTELFPVYTLTLGKGLGNKTVKVQTDEKAKNLTAEGSCLKLVQGDFLSLQVDVGEGDDNRKVLCSNSKEESSLKCSENNYTVHLYGVPPIPNDVVLSPADYNKSKNCEWFNGN